MLVYGPQSELGSKGGSVWTPTRVGVQRRKRAGVQRRMPLDFNQDAFELRPQLELRRRRLEPNPSLCEKKERTGPQPELGSNGGRVWTPHRASNRLAAAAPSRAHQQIDRSTSKGWVASATARLPWPSFHTPAYYKFYQFSP